VNEAHSELNTGDPQTLVDFVKWAKAAAPAKHYMLIISGHNAGWYKLVPDATSQDALYARELRDALSAVTAELGRPLDILYVGACASGSIELLSEVVGQVVYYIGTQTIHESSEFWGDWLTHLSEQPEMEPINVALDIVEAAAQTEKDVRFLVDVSRITETDLFGELRRFVTAAVDDIRTGSREVASLYIPSTTDYGAKYNLGNYDLYHYMESIMAVRPSGSVYSTAQSIRDAVEPRADGLVKRVRYGTLAPQASKGLTVNLRAAYLPSDCKGGYDYYSFLASRGTTLDQFNPSTFDTSTNWSEFQRALACALGCPAACGGTDPGPDPVDQGNHEAPDAEDEPPAAPVDQGNHEAPDAQDEPPATPAAPMCGMGPTGPMLFSIVVLMISRVRRTHGCA